MLRTLGGEEGLRACAREERTSGGRARCLRVRRFGPRGCSRSLALKPARDEREDGLQLSRAGLRKAGSSPACAPESSGESQFTSSRKRATRDADDVVGSIQRDSVLQLPTRARESERSTRWSRTSRCRACRKSSSRIRSRFAHHPVAGECRPRDPRRPRDGRAPGRAPAPRGTSPRTRRGETALRCHVPSVQAAARDTPQRQVCERSPPSVTDVPAPVARALS